MKTISDINISDWQAASLLQERGVSELGEYLVYKACVALSVTGLQHHAENNLNVPYVDLLKARRALQNENFILVKQILGEAWSLSKEHPYFYELSGDRYFILATSAHRQSQPEKAEELYRLAVSEHAQGADSHRALRSLINQHICLAPLESYLYGDIFFLKQKAMRHHFYDLVGNIEKAMTTELLLHGRCEAALVSAQSAIAAYEKDGGPMDRAVAVALLGIAQLQLGFRSEAEQTAATLQIDGGKVSIYQKALKALLGGEAPEIPNGHPLSGILLQGARRLKDNSVPGKIVQILSEQPMERDHLIQRVWGPNCLDESYCSRLYTAIKELRKKHLIQIEFDGQYYRLPSSQFRVKMN